MAAPEPSSPILVSRAAIMAVIEGAYRDGVSDGIWDRDRDFDADYWASLVDSAVVNVDG